MTEDEIKDLRHAFGQFATGVTIVTTAGPHGEPVGITANSFSSVSLQPPMVLWSLSDEALSRPAFESSEYFCVHVLTTNQRELSERFALRGEDKFAGTNWTHGPGQMPMFDEFVARFQCRTADRYVVGDHVVFVGEVIKYDKTGERPLVFHGGQYALAERRTMEKVAQEVSEHQPFPGDRRNRTN